MTPSELWPTPSRHQCLVNIRTQYVLSLKTCRTNTQLEEEQINLDNAELPAASSLSGAWPRSHGFSRLRDWTHGPSYWQRYRRGCGVQASLSSCAAVLASLSSRLALFGCLLMSGLHSVAADFKHRRRCAQPVAIAAVVSCMLSVSPFLYEGTTRLNARHNPGTSGSPIPTLALSTAFLDLVIFDQHAKFSHDTQVRRPPNPRALTSTVTACITPSLLRNRSTTAVAWPV